MQERQKWCKARTNLKVGDIVVVVDPTSPRSSWPLARLLETKPDTNRDGPVIQTADKDQHYGAAYHKAVLAIGRR